MSNKKAYLLGILTVFCFNMVVEVFSEAIYLRARRKMDNAGVIVGVEIATNKNNKNGSKDSKDTEKEGS